MSTTFRATLLADPTNEAPALCHPFEWWFIQGHYEDGNADRRHFMVSIFQHMPDSATTSLQAGCSVLISVLDPTQEMPETLSIVDRQSIMLLHSLNNTMHVERFDQELIAAMTNEISMFGPFRPIVLLQEAPTWSSRILRFDWQPVHLRQNTSGFELCFTEPNSQRAINLTLTTSRPGVQITGFNDANKELFTLHTYSRLILDGTANNATLQGHGWLDHQWGSFNDWYSQASDKQVLGWEWFGINIQDGPDIIICTQRDMNSHEVFEQVAIICSSDSAPRICTNFQLIPIKTWTSPRTNVTYPTSWTIHLQPHNISLQFNALAEDQEIPVFGLTRAIWQGAGQVLGRIDDQHVTGWARLELHGYAWITDFKKVIDDFASRTKEHIAAFFPPVLTEAHITSYLGQPHWQHEVTGHNAVLSQPVWDLMSRPGKCWRPLFGVFMLGALGISIDPYLQLLACTSEMLHNGALIIDDIEDRSLLRRGEDCIHHRYGLDVALNAGNTLYFLPYLLLENHPYLTASQRLALYQLFIRQATRCHFGQGLDIYWSSFMDASRLTHWLEDDPAPKILQMYAYKTATASEGMAEMACIIAESSPEVHRACAAFGRLFGVAFQLMDDIHNFSESPKWTKTCGEDIQNGKLTYVIVQALQRLRGKDRKRLHAILGSARLRTKALPEAIRLIHASGALEACREEARTMFEEQWHALSLSIPTSEPKTMLRVMCSRLLEISFD